MQTKPLTPSTKSFLATFKSKSNLSQSNENEAPKPTETLSPNESFDHLSLEFLKESNLMDSQSRRPIHPDYDGTTLFVPPSFMVHISNALYINKISLPIGKGNPNNVSMVATKSHRNV